MTQIQSLWNSPIRDGTHIYKYSYNKTLKKRKIKNTLIGASPFIIAVGAGAVYLMNSWGSGFYNSGIGYWP